MSEQKTDNAKLVLEVLNGFNTYKEDRNEETFLSVIHREHDENYISRIIAYTLSKDRQLIRKLMEIYSKKHPQNNINIESLDFNASKISVELEKYMDGKRADIFVELPEPKITITIENKIYSWEHDDQTRHYYNWVSKQYKDYQNFFFYLRPGFNMSSPSSGKFLDITYSDFKDLISQTSNPVISDLKRHIELYLEGIGMKFEGYEETVVNNYGTITKIIKEVEKKNRIFKRQMNC